MLTIEQERPGTTRPILITVSHDGYVLAPRLVAGGRATSFSGCMNACSCEGLFLRYFRPDRND